MAIQKLYCPSDLLGFNFNSTQSALIGKATEEDFLKSWFQ